MKNYLSGTGKKIAGAIYEKRYRGSVEGHNPYNFNEW